MVSDSLEAKVAGLDALVRAHDAGIGVRLDALAAGQARIESLLTGNGEPSKGLVVRVDRLEQADVHRQWHVRLLSAGVIGGVIEWVFRRLHG